MSTNMENENATGTTESTGGSTAAPATAHAALERAASSAAQTQASSTATGTTGTVQPPTGQGAANAGATGQTGQPATSVAGSTAASGSATGEAPEARIQAAVRNAREQARREREQELYRQYGWQQAPDPQAVGRAMRLAQMLEQDPRAFYARLAQELGPDQEADAEADLVAGDGKTKAFSETAHRQSLRALEARLRKEIGQQIQPLLTEHQQAQQRRQTDELANEGRQIIGQAVSHLNAFPMFKDNQDAISKEMQQIPKETVDRIGIVASMYMASFSWLAKSLDTRVAEAVAKDRENLKRSAATAAGSVVPGGQQPSGQSRSPRNVEELAQSMARRFEAAGV